MAKSTARRGAREPLPTGVALRSVRYSAPEPPDESYPFSLPILADLDELPFPTPITFLVGENGSGKSSLLEAIAVGADLQTLGGQDTRRDPTLADARRLAAALRFIWGHRARQGFFLRAEDFFGFATRTDLLVAEMETLAADHPPGSHAHGVLKGQAAAVRRQYGELHARSHGEGFLDVFQARLLPGGLYLLDEPDTAFSALRQLALVAVLRDIAAQGAQAIIATHSPILLACPGATIYHLDNGKVVPARWEDLPGVQLTRDFLEDPEAFLRHL